MNTYVPTMTLYDAQVFKVCFVMLSPRFPIPPSINPRLIGWGRQSSQQVSNTGHGKLLLLIRTPPLSLPSPQRSARACEAGTELRPEGHN